MPDPLGKGGDPTRAQTAQDQGSAHGANVVTAGAQVSSSARDRAAEFRFRVLLDGAPADPAHGLNGAENGSDVLTDAGRHQFVRQSGGAAERTPQITVAGPGAEAYAGTVA